jgi:CheY-like chemotaxis protein
VELHGGTIEARSPGPGLGSEFVVTLPLVADSEAITAPEKALPNEASSTKITEAVRVLVVDDNTDLVQMVASALKRKGYEVQSASTGQEALQVVDRWLPHVALLDIGLPGLDGYEVAKRLKSSPETSAIHLIAITGYGRNEDISLAREAGFQAHLVKPFDFDDLERLLAASDAPA